jgi:hypothetical protein
MWQGGTWITDTYYEYVKGSVKAHIEQRKQRRVPRNHGHSAGGVRNWTQPLLNLILHPFGNTPANASGKRSSPVNDFPDEDLQEESRSGSELKRRYLQLCITRHRMFTDTTYSTLYLNMETDGELYDLLHARYIGLIGPLRRLLLPRKIGIIRFVKVYWLAATAVTTIRMMLSALQMRLRNNKLVTIDAHSLMQDAYAKDCLPPNTNPKEYDFIAEEKFFPPVGHNEMLRFLYGPRSEIGRDDDVHLSRIPCLLVDPVTFEKEEVFKHIWGIEMVESLVWKYLFVPVFLVIVGSMIFGSVYSVLMDNVEGGFTVAAYMVSAGLSGLGAMQCILESI